MTPEVWSANVFLGFLAALGAAFCFGYAIGHHLAGRSSPRPPAHEPSHEAPRGRSASAVHHAFRLRRRRSHG